MTGPGGFPTFSEGQGEYWKQESNRIQTKAGESLIQRIWNKAKHCLKGCSKHPVILHSGVKVTYDVDFILPGKPAIQFSRTYVGDMDEFSALGRNRIGALEEMLLPGPDRSLIFRMGNGDIASFRRPSPNLGEVSHGFGYAYLKLAAGPKGSFVLRHGDLSKRFTMFDRGVWLLSEVYDLNGNVAHLVRDDAGVLARLDRSDGFTFLFENNQRGFRSSVTLRAPNGEMRLISRYSYDRFDNLIEVRNRYGRSFRYRYDALNRFAGYEDGAVTSAEYRYDDAGRVDMVATPGSRFDHAISYEAAARATTLTYVLRPQTKVRYTFDANGNASTITDGLGHSRAFQYNDEGTLLSETDAEGHRTDYTYDSNGSLKSITDPEGRRTAAHRDGDGRLVKLVDPGGNAWAWGYDQRGNLSWSRDPLGHRTDVSNNAAGLPTTIMRHDGLIETRAYDSQNNLALLIDYRGSKTSFERDAFGRVTKTTNALGRVTRYTYDENAGADFWSASTITRPDGVFSKRVVDTETSTIIIVNGEGRRTIYRYGPFGLLEAMEDPEGGRLLFAYDHAEALIEVTNQVGRKWMFERDAAGRVVRQTDFDGMVTHYRYDRSNRLVEILYEDGSRVEMGYDRGKLLLRETLFGPGSAGPVVTRWTYDANGRLRSGHNENGDVVFERDALGRVTAETVNGRRTENVYDCCDNRLEARTHGRVVRSRYDPLGAMSELTIGEHPPLRLTHDAAGYELRRDNGFGFEIDQSWDAVGQLLWQIAPARPALPDTQPAAVIQRGYRWNKASAPISVIDARWGETRFDHDANGQVVAARHGDGLVERFGYARTLNIEASSDGGALQAWSRTPGGQVRGARGPCGKQVTLTYDSRRRVIERVIERGGDPPRRWLYGWDGRNRLMSCVTPAGEVWRYGYDAFARRVWKAKDLREDEKRYYAIRHPQFFDVAAIAGRGDMSVSSRSRLDTNAPGDRQKPTVGTSYAWDGDIMVAEAPLKLDGTTDWAAATRWHYAPTSHAPLAREAADGTLLYVVTDVLGTPRELVDEDGALRFAATYRVWGDRIAWQPAGAAAGENSSSGEHVQGESDPCPLRFQGQWADEETGLSYNRFRYYDATAAQYASPDPLGFLGGARPHGYVPRPTTEIDPLGLYCCNNGHKYKTIHDKVCDRTLSQSEGQDLIQRFTVPNGNAGNISPPGQYLVTQNDLPGGYVNTTYNLDTLTGTNVTTPYHAFQGTITRQVTFSGGASYIDTNGSGNAGDNLLGLARDNLNSTLGPGVFAGVDSKAAAYAAANYPGC